MPLPFQAQQVLYRTTKQSGAAIAVVATILKPALASTTKLLSYQTAYDDLGSTCTPSYALNGGATTGTTPTLEPGFMAAYLAQGFTVVTSDYEGLTHDYTAGQGAGMATLDGIRAARAALGVPDATPVGLLGYSGGATATQWASELAAAYAPETNIVAIAEGGTPVHYGHIINYVQGTKSWGGVLPYVLVGLFRGADIDISKYLNEKGKKALAYVSDKCLDTKTYAGARLEDFLDGGRDWRTIRPLAKVVNSQIMGTLGTPQAPIFMGTGNADGIGDGVMIVSDTEALAHRYCLKGVPVAHRKYQGLDHIGALAPFEAEALAFIQARMNDLPIVDECPTIGTGRALTGLALPPLPRFVLGKVRRASKGFTLTARVDRETADGVTLTVYALRGAKRTRVRVTAVKAGALTTAPLTVSLPRPRRGVAGRTYEIVATGRADEERITGSTTFRGPRVRAARAQ